MWYVSAKHLYFQAHLDTLKIRFQFDRMNGWCLMPNPRLEPQQISAIIDYLNERFNAHTVILFGSAARGEMRQDSDVDIAYISEDPPHSAYELFMAASELANRVGREVDLIYFPQANPVFKAQIIGTGEVLQDVEPYVRQTAFMQALKEYALLNDERKEIMENYQRGGAN